MYALYTFLIHFGAFQAIPHTLYSQLGYKIHMLTHLRLDNRRGWVRGWAKLCTCLIG